MTETRQEFAESIADYVMTHELVGTMSKRAVARAAVLVLLDDIGAAQRFLDVIGVDFDLYESTFRAKP